MRKLVFLFLILSLSSFAQSKKKSALKYWDDMTEKDRQTAIADTALSPIVKIFHTGQFSFVSANQAEVIKLFKALSSESEHGLAVRLYNFNKLIMAADTLLTGLLNEHGTKIIYNQTDLTIKYLNRERNKKNMLYKKYIPYLAADLNERIEFQNFKFFLDSYYNLADQNTKQFLQILYKELEAAGAGKLDAK
jgi:hypothetical protein